MRVFQMYDFKKLAQPVAVSYINGNTPLVDGLVKTALEHGLNPDQIQTLVNAVNSMTHLMLFDQKHDDKIIEFEPADVQEVLKKVYKVQDKPEGSTVECAPDEAGDSALPGALSRTEDFFSELPDLMGRLRSSQNAGDTEKSTDISPDGTVTHVEKSVGPGSHMLAVTKVKKVAEELDTRKMAAALEYQDTLDELASEFAKLYGPDHAEFEKSAVALYKEAAYPVLNDIRECLKMDRLTSDNIKTASASIVDDTTPELKKVSNMLRLRVEHREYDEAAIMLRRRLRGV